MPFFTKKSPTPPTFDNNNHKSSTTTNNVNILSTASQLPMAQHIIEKKLPPPTIDANILKPQLVFHCQLAHGSPTGLISGFGSVKELYQKIAECYDFSVDEVSHFSHVHLVNFYFSHNWILTPSQPKSYVSNNVARQLVLFYWILRFATFFFCESWCEATGESWRCFSSLLMNVTT